MSHDYYHILGLAPSAGEELIEKAYRILALQHHPDRGGDAAQFQLLTEAHQVLSHPDRKRRYDQAMQSRMKGTAAPRDAQVVLSLRFEQAAKGGHFTVSAPSSARGRVEVNVPPAAEDGLRLCVSGQGPRIGNTPRRGDLFVILHVESDPRFRRDGLDLYTDVPVPLDVAVNGGTVQAMGLFGKVAVPVPAGCNSGDKLRVRAAGLRNAKGQHGDLYAISHLQLTPQAARALREPTAASSQPAAPAGDLNQTLAARARELGTLRDQIDADRQSLKAESQALAELQEKLVQREKTLQRHEDELLAGQQRLSELHRRQEAESKSLADRQTKLQQAESQIAQQRQELQRQQHDLLQRQKKQEAEEKALQAVREVADQDRRQLADQQRQVEAERKRLADVQRELDALRKQLAEDRGALDAARAALQDQTHTLTHSQKTVREREAKIESRTRQIQAQQDRLDDRVRQIDAQQRAARIEQQDLQQQRSRLDADTAAVQKQKAECERNAVQLTAERRQLDAERMQMESQQKQIAAQEAALRKQQADWEAQRKAEAKQAESKVAEVPILAAPPSSAPAIESIGLLLIDRAQRSHYFHLDRPRTILGRQEPANLRLYDTSVSRTHCCIELRDGQVWAEDLQSTNGSYRNGQRISQAKLEAGDILSVGNIRMVVIINDQPSEVLAQVSLWSDAIAGVKIEFDGKFESPCRRFALHTPRRSAKPPAPPSASAPAPAAPKRAAAQASVRPRLAEVSGTRFTFEPCEQKFDLDASPNHVRSCCGIVDAAGTRFLFAESLTQEQGPGNSWAAVLHVYRRTTRERKWHFVQELPRGEWTGDAATSDADCFGLAHASVAVADGQMLLFYAGRGGIAPGATPNLSLERNEPGHMTTALCLATAPVDDAGGLAGPLQKQGVVLRPSEGWEELRIDQPAVLIDDQFIHLWYTGYDHATDLTRRRLGYARAKRSQAPLTFEKTNQPVLQVAGGGHLPHVFYYRNTLHLYLRHFDRGEGTAWRHYVGSDPTTWQLRESQVKLPDESATLDLCIFTDTAGRLPADALGMLSTLREGQTRLTPVQILPLL